MVELGTLSDFYLERVGDPLETHQLYYGDNSVGGNPSPPGVINHIWINSRHCEDAFHCWIMVALNDTVSIQDVNTVEGIYVNSVRLSPSNICPVRVNSVIGMVGGFRNVEQLIENQNCFAYFLRKVGTSEHDVSR